MGGKVGKTTQTRRTGLATGGLQGVHNPPKCIICWQDVPRQSSITTEKKDCVILFLPKFHMTKVCSFSCPHSFAVYIVSSWKIWGCADVWIMINYSAEPTQAHMHHPQGRAACHSSAVPPVSLLPSNALCSGHISMKRARSSVCSTVSLCLGASFRCWTWLGFDGQLFMSIIWPLTVQTRPLSPIKQALRSAAWQTGNSNRSSRA